jgi:hypothetical protein
MSEGISLNVEIAMAKLNQAVDGHSILINSAKKSLSALVEKYSKGNLCMCRFFSLFK